MAAIPRASETVQDPGLGVVEPASNLHVIIGVTTAATAATVDPNTLYLYSDPTALVAEQGGGPAVEAACHVLKTAGGPVGLCPIDPSVAASNSAVTESGPAGPNVTVTGDATNDYYVVVRILTGGALGTATFEYCLDGLSTSIDSERTWSGPILTPSGNSYEMPGTGLTLGFTTGTQVAGTIHEFQAECAAGAAADFGDALEALALTPVKWRHCSAVTTLGNGDETDHATLAAAVQAELVAMAGASKYRRGIIAADLAGDDAAVMSAYAGVTADRMMITFGNVRRLASNPLVGYNKPSISGLSCFAGRAAQAKISEDLKRRKSGAVGGGAILHLYQDEARDPTGLDDIKVSTLRNSSQGYVITQARLKSAAGSDFAYWPRGLVMDVACETVHDAQELLIGQQVRFDDRVINGQLYPGTISDLDADRFEDEIGGKLNAILLDQINAEGRFGHVTDLRYRISRTNNIVATGTLISFVEVKPVAYIDYVTTTLGFVLDFEAA